ncbi:hypothetical protein [Neorhizobium galegae]|uniref:hypothetical protein n=1 Tax=Neorhizobium galegae TaxID=399 RepID=UPI0012D3BF33|nr:hypothetical protein [Neorhizobium galegae]MCQ1854586.1 hypothetical protein [Neorhizobium galegae]
MNTLLHRLGMPVSDDTILRQLKHKNSASIQKDTIRVVGIVDWIWQHSSRYRTIMVDLEHHSVVEVLDDGSVESANAWFQAHPTVEIVSRCCRSNLMCAYSRACAPKAISISAPIGETNRNISWVDRSHPFKSTTVKLNAGQSYGHYRRTEAR